MCPCNQNSFYCFTTHTFIFIVIIVFGYYRMASHEISMIKQRFLNGHLPQLKTTGGNVLINKRSPQKQPKLRSSSIFPPISQNLVSGAGTIESSNSSNREAPRYSLTKNNLPSLSPRSSLLQIPHNAPPRRSTRYDHIPSKINTGLPRTENQTRNEGDTYQLGPSQPVNWHLLKHELEQDTQIRAQSKRIQFNSGVTYTTQLTTLSNLARTKVKSHLSSVMNPGEERYKIVVQLHVFQALAGGLHIASRCLWNTLTDNSITLRMQGIDCDLLFVVFLCYTDVGLI